MKKIILVFIIGIIVISGFGNSTYSNYTFSENGFNKMFFENPPIVQWNKSFGGDSLDWGWSVKQTEDNCFIITGETVSFGSGGYDAWLIKTDENGNELWNKTFGGDIKDGGRTVIQTNDNGYIIGGYADSFGYPNHDFWLIKTDETGNEIWNKTYGGVSSDAGYSIQQTSDDGFVLVGYTYTFSKGSKDIWLIKTDEFGNLEYNMSYGGFGSEHGMSIQNTVDDGFVIAGVSSSFGGGDDDGWIIKTDSYGNELWNKTFGGINVDWFGSIYQTQDNGYIVVGDTKSYGNGGFDIWLLRLDNNGNEIWNRTFGKREYDETGYCVKQTIDGGFIVCGAESHLQTGITDGCLLKIDQNGSLIWNLTIGGKEDDLCYYVDQCKDGGFILTGYTSSYVNVSRDLWLIKVSNSVNQPPDYLFIDGPKTGRSGESYEYEFSCVDPEGDNVFYYIEWGDGQIEEWIGPFESGVTIYKNHVWIDRGLYDIRLKARDDYGSESDWKTFEVSMPYLPSLIKIIINLLDINCPGFDSNLSNYQ